MLLMVCMSNQVLYDGRMMEWVWEIKCCLADASIDALVCSTLPFVVATVPSAAAAPSVFSSFGASPISVSAFSGRGASGASSGLSDGRAGVDSEVSCLMAISVEVSVVQVSVGFRGRRTMSQKSFDYIPLVAPPWAVEDASVCCGAAALVGGLDGVAGESMLRLSESMMLVV